MLLTILNLICSHKIGWLLIWGHLTRDFTNDIAKSISFNSDIAFRIKIVKN